MKTINDRYEIIESLSKEANWIEYLVKDTQDDGVKRIRIFDTEMSNYEFIAKMETEFINLKNIVHENLLALKEFQPIYSINGSRISRKQYFYTYEHYDDEQVVHYLDLNKSEINSALVQLVKAIRFLHHRGFIYKYLSFDNILFIRSKNKILVKVKEIANIFVNDYNFKMDHDHFNQFIAPEIMWGDDIDKTVDIYSLGVIFYYLYYKMDFSNRQLSQALRSSGTNDIHKFIVKATSHIKEERHAGMHEFITELSRLIWLDVSYDDAPYYNQFFDDTKIVGRESILKDITTLMHEKYMKALNYNAIYIKGETGIGKTRILREIFQIAKFNRYPYFWVATNKEQNKIFPTVYQIVNHILNQDDASPMLLQKYALELSSVCPHMSERLKIKQEKLLNLEENSLRILNRIFNFFLEYTSDKFMVLFIDNENKVSDAEQYFYNMLLNYSGMSNYLLILSGPDSTQNIRKKNKFVRTIKLPSLTLEETGEIVKYSLGIDHIPYKLTHRLMMENQGKASITKKILKKLWLDGHIFFDIENDCWNLESFDDKYVFEFYESTRENYELQLSELPENYIEYLKKLSVIRNSFNMNFIFQFCHIDEETGYTFLSDMEAKRILNKRISDVEYVFVFYDNDFKKVLMDMLDEDERIALYRQAANYYENRFMAFQEINEPMVDYLLLSGAVDLAADYCILFAEHFQKQFNNLKASELYERAYEIFLESDKIQIAMETGLKLVRQLIKLGKIELAHTYVNKLTDYIDEMDADFKVDLDLEQASIMYYKNDVDRSSKLSRNCIDAAVDIKYVEGEYRAVQMLCKCLTHYADLDQHQVLALKYLQKSITEKNLLQEAVFHNELGANYLYRNAFDQSLESFTKSLECYQSLKDEENIIKLYNNIGVVHFEGNGDYLVARDFFRKAYTHALNRNYVVATPIHLNNLGETYFIEGRYEMAIKYFEEAHSVAEKIGDKSSDLLSLLNLCATLIQVESYSKAYTLMNRLEHEFSTFEKSSYNKLDYYLLHLDFFLAMNSIMQVDHWKYELSSIPVDDVTRTFKLKIVDLYLNYMKNDLIKERTGFFDDQFDLLVNDVSKPSEVKLVRNFLLDVLIDLVNQQDYITAEKLFRWDVVLSKKYNTKSVRLKSEVIAAALSDYSIERIENHIASIEEVSQELLWKVYMILGNEYLSQGNLYQALRYYLMALDVVYDLTNLVPLEYKETYILYDNSKMALKNKINRITGRLLSLDGVLQNTIYDERFETVDDFFDLSQLNRLYHSQEFIKLARENMQTQESLLFDTSIDLIKNLEKDEITNLRMIINYLKQLTLAERGFIYLLDESDQVGEIISTTNNKSTYDVNRLINILGNDIEGVYVAKIDPKTNIQLLSVDQKGLMCFPIYETASDNSSQVNRKEDLLLSKQKIVGYVFLDSTNLINRFDEETFKQAKSFINLIYVFIDNYNLKRISTIDKLTGVYLRKHLEQQFAIHMNISRQYNYNLSLIMLDIDKFKFVNDTYGHRKGDEILSKIGSLLKNSVRSSDYVARYGGEEFIILLPEADSSVGYKVAEKIRTLIDENRLLGDEVPLTVSLGVATYPKDGANEEELIEKADQALYYSKNNGRNQSTSWDEKLIKERHRYDQLTGILTGNISSDTRNVKAVMDILNQLNHNITREESIKNTFISLLDITEGDEIQFILYDHEHEIEEVLYKKKGQDEIKNMMVLDQRLIEQIKTNIVDRYFIDWEGFKRYDIGDKDPSWKSYIVVKMYEGSKMGILSIAVDITEKEFDFSNYNFVEALKPVLEHILFD